MGLVLQNTGQDLHASLVQALEAIGTPYGLRVTLTAQQRGDTMTFTLAMTQPGYSAPLPKVSLQDRDRWDELAQGFGVPRDWLGKTIAVNGRRYQILGIEEEDDDRPLICRDLSTGKSTRLSLDDAYGIQNSLVMQELLEEWEDEDEEAGNTPRPSRRSTSSTPSDRLRKTVREMQETLNEGGYVGVTFADGTHGIAEAVRLSPDQQRIQARMETRRYRDVIDYEID